MKVVNEDKWLDYLSSGGRVLILAWHQQFFPFSVFFKRYSRFKPSLMISQSKDGEVVAQLANRIGWKTVRGSSSKDGLKALEEMKENLRTHRLAGHIADGPRGPIGILKKGAIHLAHDTEAKIVPVYAVPSRAWYCKSWDKFMIPKPFSTITVLYGDLYNVDGEPNPQMFEEHRQRLEKVMSRYLLQMNSE